MASAHGLSLEFSDGRAAPRTLEGINTELRKTGAGVWPLELQDQPSDVQALLAKPLLDKTEAQRIQEHFLLPRGRLLQIVTMAGRTPEVAGGGALHTYVTNQGYGYPQLYQVRKGVDYSRFDRFHVNVGPNGGSGVDEVFQMLSGSGFVIHQRLDDGRCLTLRLDCRDDGQGWIGTYSGIRPHIGSISSAKAGAKLLVQAFGAKEWMLTYVEEPVQ